MKLSRTAIGMAVRAARDQARLTSADLAEQTGIDKSALSRTENGIRALEFGEALAIAKALKVDVEVLRTFAETFEREGAHEKKQGIKQFEKDLNLLQREAIAAAIELAQN